MIDLKTMNSALEQLEEERGIPKIKVIGAIEDALTAAYKKDYGHRGQIIRSQFDLASGKTEFFQVKIVVDQAMLQNTEKEAGATALTLDTEPQPEKVIFNEEQHIMLEDAKKIKRDAQAGEELVFPLETKEDFGRIAAQTAKQVVIQRIREAERISVLEEYNDRQGQIITGKVQKLERGNVFVDLGRTTAILPHEEQIPGEYYRQGERIRAYLYAVEETPRGVNLKLSRSHPKFVEQLFAQEAPEIASGTVEFRATAREAGSRTKIAVSSKDRKIDPVGSCVGGRGVRVNTVISELGGEKIDIIEWSDSPEIFIGNALAPAKIKSLNLNQETREAKIEVATDQFSLAVGRGGQNARLAAKLTGWRIEIVDPELLTKQEENKTNEPAA